MDDSFIIGMSTRDALRQSVPVEIPLSALTRHICILGATGSGKSTTAGVIARSLASHGVSTMIFDRAGEYARSMDDVPGAKVYRPGDGLAMALLQPSEEGSTAAQVEGWVALFNHYTTVTFGSQVSPLQARVLREVLARYYGGTREVLTVSRLISKLDAYEGRFRARNGWEESIEALISRLVPLTVDLVGKTFDVPYSTLKLEALFDGSLSIFDMSAMEEDGGKNLLSQLVLKRLYQAMRTKDITDDVRLAVILDEAQHLAPNKDYLGIPERCAIELRKYGFSLVTIATRPSLVSPNILSNSGTLISHLLVNERDVEAVAGHLLGGSEERSVRHSLRTLQTGMAVVQRNFPAPVLPVVCRVGMTGLLRRTSQRGPTGALSGAFP